MVKQTAYCCTSSLFVYVLTQKLCLQCRYSVRVTKVWDLIKVRDKEIQQNESYSETAFCQVCYVCCVKKNHNIFYYFEG